MEKTKAFEKFEAAPIERGAWVTLGLLVHQSYSSYLRVELQDCFLYLLRRCGWMSRVFSF